MARPAKKKKAPVKSNARKPARKSVKAVKKTVKKAAKPKTVTSAKPAKKAAKPVKAVKAAAPKASKAARLDIGSPVPDFTMPATKLGQVSRDALKGKPFVLYFYPKDDTSGCTAEACEFRNTLPAFEKLGVAVIGVSKDSMESHEKFSRKYNLNFPLGSDESAGVCEAFGTWVQKSMYGRTYMGIERSTFLIDAKGVVRAVWRKVSVSGHVDEVRKALENL